MPLLLNDRIIESSDYKAPECSKLDIPDAVRHRSDQMDPINRQRGPAPHLINHISHLIGKFKGAELICLLRSKLKYLYP